MPLTEISGLSSRLIVPLHKYEVQIHSRNARLNGPDSLT